MAQARLKEVVTASTRTAVAESDGGVQSRITTSTDHAWIIDEPPSRGGRDEGAAPLEHFTASLASCQMVQVVKVAEAMRFKHGAIRITADIGTNMVIRDEEKNLLLRFTEAEMIIDIETEEPDAKLERLAVLAEDRCPVGTLLGDGGIEVKCTWNRLPLPEGVPANA